jgi:hypothetical protein
MLPHRVNTRSTPQWREASHGSYWHRRAQDGKPDLRSLLVQAAVSIRRLRHPTTTALREWTERLAARRGRFIAVVALARRLAGILYARLRDGTRDQPARARLAPSTGAVAAA